MRKYLLVIATLITVGAAAAPAHAGLGGDSMTVEWDFPTLGTLYQGPLSVTVPNVIFFNNGADIFTITDNQIIETFNFAGTAFYTAASFNGYIFVDTTNSGITDVTVDTDTNVPGLTDANVAFTANSITLNLQGLLIDGTQSIIKLNVTSTPEPATAALLATFLIGFATTRRRSAEGNANN